jgi:hypothetical protein
MSRVSSVVLGTVLLGIVVAASGCQVQASIKTKNRFVEPNVVQEDTEEWTGQPIKIDIQGVGVSINGGVNVTAVQGLTKVKATSRMLAMAFSEEKPNADQSILDAKATFKITNSASGITVACGHGGSHGSSNAGESGCELVEIQVPAGDGTTPLDVTVLSGNGTVNIQLSNAVLKNVGVNSNGGDISAEIAATQGANVSFVSEKSDDIAVGLPSDFAADEIVLQADADQINLGPFTDAKNGAGAGGRGTAGTGLASLKVTSKEFAGSTGSITLR